MTWSSSLLLMQPSSLETASGQSGKASEAYRVKVLTSAVQLLHNKVTQKLSTSLRLQDSQMALGGPPLGQSVESTVTSGA